MSPNYTFMQWKALSKHILTTMPIEQTPELDLPLKSFPVQTLTHSIPVTKVSGETPMNLGPEVYTSSLTRSCSHNPSSMLNSGKDRWWKCHFPDSALSLPAKGWSPTVSSSIHMEANTSTETKQNQKNPVLEDIWCCWLTSACLVTVSRLGTKGWSLSPYDMAKLFAKIAFVFWTEVCNAPPYPCLPTLPEHFSNLNAYTFACFQPFSNCEYTEDESTFPYK